ncbi:MAG: OadG family protein [Eubacterium sp.]|nr:OadG family protein [Eubacterium sp.]
MNHYLLTTTLQPDSSLAFTLTLVVAGIGTVLAMLALLILIFKLFGATMSLSQKRAEKKKSKANKADGASADRFPDISQMPVIEPLPPVEAGADGDVTPEIVAAITAAVYMLEGDGVTVTSVTKRRSRPSGRPVWAQAAVNENTRPF